VNSGRFKIKFSPKTISTSNI